MNLIELKEKIAAHLATLTIDDYYLDPSLASTKALFEELTGCSNDEEIQEYLINEIPNTDYDAYVKSIRESIASQHSALAAANQQMAKTKAQKENLDKQIAEIQQKQKAIPEKQKEIQVSIAQIDTEANQIKPLTSNTIYAKRINELEKERANLEKQIIALPFEAAKLNEEIASLRTKKKAAQNQVNEEQVRVNQLNNDVLGKETLLKDAEKKRTTYFEDQANALNFLLGLLLGMKAKNSNYGGYNKNEPLERIDKDKRRILIITALGNNMVFPQDWRVALNDIFSQPIPEFSGSLAKPEYERETYLVREKLQISDTDLGAILSLRIAIENGYSLQLQSNQIALALPGGLLAKIIFRNKPASLSKFQKSEVELFAKGYEGHSDRTGQWVIWRNKSENLFHQTGYANSQLEITIPYGYYVLTEAFVIDITFEAAPMLLGAEAVARFAPNIAGKAKKDKERLDREEEDRRREEEDWD